MYCWSCVCISMVTLVRWHYCWLLLTMHVLLVMCVYQHGNTSEVTLLLITVDNACIVGRVCVCFFCHDLLHSHHYRLQYVQISCHNGRSINGFVYFKALSLSLSSCLIVSRMSLNFLISECNMVSWYCRATYEQAFVFQARYRCLRDCLVRDTMIPHRQEKLWFSKEVSRVELRWLCTSRT